MSESLAGWVKEEFSQIELGDKRLNRRFKTVATGLAGHSKKNICSAFSCWAGAKATYRFFENKKVTSKKIMDPHKQKTIERILNEKIILNIQDTVYFNFNGDSRKNLDIIKTSCNGDIQNGLMLHHSLAVTTRGEPLGCLYHDFLVRKELNKDRRKNHAKLPVEEKESYRWIESIKMSNRIDFKDTQIVHVADREADFYELYRECLDIKEKFIIRASFDRTIAEPIVGTMFKTLALGKPQGSMKVRVQQKGKKGKYRDAILSVYYSPITFLPPDYKSVKRNGKLPRISLIGIMAIEENPPEGEEGIKWVLLTNLPVNNLDDAIEKIRWYSFRWNIELFHKIIKSGFAIESAQLRDGVNLKKYITLKCILAWRIFYISRLSEDDLNESCETLLTESEWSILFKKMNKGAPLPKLPPTLRDVRNWIGRLGGFLGRKGDGAPGYKALWEGWHRFENMVEDYRDLCT